MYTFRYIEKIKKSEKRESENSYLLTLLRIRLPITVLLGD